MAVTIANMIAASGLAFWGIMMAAVPAVLLLGTLGAVLVATFMLDEVKIWFFRKTGILGGLSGTPPKLGA
jgi:H+-transporting ATPase